MTPRVGNWTHENALECAAELSEHSGRSFSPALIRFDGAWWRVATNGLVFVACESAYTDEGVADATEEHAVSLRDKLMPTAREAAVHPIDEAALRRWCHFSHAGVLDGRPIDRSLLRLALREFYGDGLRAGWAGDTLGLVAPGIIAGVAGLTAGTVIAPREITFAEIALRPS